MYVKDLIKELSRFDPECKVYLSKDAEGNRFSTLYEVSENVEDEDGDFMEVVLWP